VSIGLSRRGRPDTTLLASFDSARGAYTVRYEDEEYVWEPWTNIAVTVIARVTFGEIDEWYWYSYTMSPLMSSRQHTNRFGICYGYPTSTLANPEGWRAWYGGLSGKADCGWNDIDASDSPQGALGIPPGSSQGGFSFASYGLPGIVDCYATGYAPLDTLRSTKYPDEMEQIRARLGSFQNKAVSGRTLGPVGSPDVDTPIGVLKRITRYVTEANDLGWLGTGDVAEFLRARLNACASLLQAGDIAEAKKQLQEMIAHLEERLASKEIEPEGADLFTLNAQWVVRHTEETRAPQHLAPPIAQDPARPYYQFRYLAEMVRQCTMLGWLDDRCAPDAGTLESLASSARVAAYGNDIPKANSLLGPLAEGIKNCTMPSDTAQYAAKHLLSTISEIQEMLKKR
jgi:hypothetical protein